MRRGRELHPVHEDMVADQQRVFHRTGGNLESLQDERNDEQPGHQNRRQRGQKFDCSLARLFFLFLFFLF